jgi:hypothetical protein
LTEIGSKWLKKQKIWSGVKEGNPLDEEIEEEILVRKVDRGKISRQKNPPVDALEHLMG